MMLLKYGLPLRRCHRRTHTALPLEERILASFWLCVKTTVVSVFGREQASECCCIAGLVWLKSSCTFPELTVLT